MPYAFEFANTVGLIFLVLMGLIFIVQTISRFLHQTRETHCLACNLKFGREGIVYFANRPFHIDCFHIAVQNYQSFNVDYLWEDPDDEQDQRAL